MKGDFSRPTFDPKKHYTSVLLQQGRVLVDADWNEQRAIIGYRNDTEVRDIIGGCGGPMDNAGFELLAPPVFHIAGSEPGTTADEGTTNATKAVAPAIDAKTTKAKTTAAKAKGPGGALEKGMQVGGDPLDQPPFMLTEFSISAGRFYVDGILIENEALVAVARQPDLPLMPGQVLFDTPGRYVAYLDVWERHITALDDPAIREVALGGPDTATRAKTVWQVKFRPVAADEATKKCGEPITAFNDAVAAPTGKMGARTRPSGPNTPPCEVASGAGFRGLENQLYRVEVHNPGARVNIAGAGGIAVTDVRTAAGGLVQLTLNAGGTWVAGQAIAIVPTAAGTDPMAGALAFVTAVAPAAAPAVGILLTLSGGIGTLAVTDLLVARHVDATFKWSRDNGTTASTIEKIAGSSVTVHDLGPDSVLGFAVGQWVEASDDVTELNGLPGQLRLITKIDEARRIITLATPLEPLAPLATMPDGVDPKRHPKLRRWDGVGAVMYNSATSAADYIALEDGIEIRFTDGTYVTGDYWSIPARTVTSDEGAGSIAWPMAADAVTPIDQAPFGIRHHYCRIAMLTVNEDLEVEGIEDCRCLFSPLTGLTGFFYVGGDGQETMWQIAAPDREEPEPPRAEPMPQPLRVGVFNIGMSNNCTPVPKARVRFRTEEAGRLGRDRAGALADAPGDGKTLIVLTDGEGIATVYWRPEWNTAKPSQTVTAHLLDGNVDQVQQVIFNGQLSIASQVAYSPAPCTNLGDNIRTVDEALDAICSKLGNCHDFLDELRSDGVVRDPDGTLGLNVTATGDVAGDGELPLVSYTAGVAYVRGCRVEVAAGSVALERSTIGQWVVVNALGIVEVLLEPIPPVGYALLAIVATLAGRVERVVDWRRDMTHLDEQVEENRRGVATTRKDARQYVPLLAGTVRDLRYRNDVGDYAYRDGRNHTFEMPAAVGGLVFDGSAIWAPLVNNQGMALIARIDRYASETTPDMFTVVNRPLGSGAFDGGRVWYTAASPNSDTQGWLTAIGAEITNPLWLPIPGRPGAIMFDGHFLWVTTNVGTLHQIDVDRNQIVRTLALPFVPGAPLIQPLALEFDGEYIWVSGTLRTLFRIQKPWGDPEPVQVVPPATSPDFNKLAFDGSHLWLLSLNGRLVQFDVLSHTSRMHALPINTLAAGELLFDGTYMWIMATDVNSEASLYRLDPRTGLITDAIPLPRTSVPQVRAPWPATPNSLRLQTFDGTHLWYPSYVRVNADVWSYAVQKMLVA